MLSIIRYFMVRLEGYFVVYRIFLCDLEGEDVNYCVNIWVIIVLVVFLRRFVLKLWSNSFLLFIFYLVLIVDWFW